MLWNDMGMLSVRKVPQRPVDLEGYSIWITDTDFTYMYEPKLISSSDKLLLGEKTFSFLLDPVFLEGVLGAILSFLWISWVVFQRCCRPWWESISQRSWMVPGDHESNGWEKEGTMVGPVMVFKGVSMYIDEVFSDAWNHDRWFQRFLFQNPYLENSWSNLSNLFQMSWWKTTQLEAEITPQPTSTTRYELGGHRHHASLPNDPGMCQAGWGSKIPPPPWHWWFLGLGTPRRFGGHLVSFLQIYQEVA